MYIESQNTRVTVNDCLLLCACALSTQELAQQAIAIKAITAIMINFNLIPTYYQKRFVNTCQLILCKDRF